MLGLEDHTPFECVGQVNETRLALSLWCASGTASSVAVKLQKECGTTDVESTLAATGQVNHAYEGLPTHLREPVLEQFEQAAKRLLERVQRALPPSSPCLPPSPTSIPHN
jgi:hypothetical protein